jgi:deazaflavin-dependent oxidoreductase (nitroreductase family)
MQQVPRAHPRRQAHPTTNGLTQVAALAYSGWGCGPTGMLGWAVRPRNGFTVATMDMQETNRRVIEQFRAGGEIDGMQRERLLLLTTTGAKTGAGRTTPLMFHRDGDRVVVMASNAGASKAPDWYANLSANPTVRVEIGDETYSATATTADGDDRDRLWSEIISLYPFFLEHERKAEREIPLVILSRAEATP